MKKKKWNPKKDLIFYSVGSTINFIVFLLIIYTIIIFIKTLIKVPSEQFTNKLVFLGLSVILIFFWVFNVVNDFLDYSVDEAKKAYKKLEVKKK